MDTRKNCELCTTPGGELIWQDEACRVVRVTGQEGADYPGFCRVIWQQHVREMTDLDAAQRAHLMRVVFAVESALRKLCQPHKINLASLGNMTPHVHWHVIPRWQDDRHFPAPIWAAPQEKPRQFESARPPIDNATLRNHLTDALSMP